MVQKMPSTDVKEAFSHLQLQFLPREWVESAWGEDLNPPPELPPEYELQLDRDLNDLLKKAREALRAWQDGADDDVSSDYSRSRISDSEDEEITSNASFASKGRSWRGLSSIISRRACVALLSAVMNSGSQEDSTEDDKDRANSAALLYLSMISITGASVFGVFSSSAFEQAISPLMSASALNGPTVRPKGRKKNNDAEVPQVALSQFARRALYHRVGALLEDLSLVLSGLPLCNHATAVTAVTKALLAAARVPLLSARAGDLLEKLCAPLHGDAALEIVKLSLPDITSDSSLNKVLGRLASIPNAYRRIVALAQKILHAVPDRADARARAAASAVDLATQLPSEGRKQFLWGLTALCHSDTVRLRLSGIEAASRLLGLEDFGSSAPQMNAIQGSPCSSNRNSLHLPPGSPFRGPPGENSSFRSSCPSSPSSAKDMMSSPSSSPEKRKNSVCSTAFGNGSIDQTATVSDTLCHKFLFAALLSRCQDLSPRARAKALSLVAPLIMSKEAHIAALMRQIFLTPGPKKEIFDFQQFFREKRHKKPLGDLDPLPSADAVIKLLRAGAEDEKVFVRKNSLQVLANVMHLSEEYITSSNLNLLVDCCRDLSVCVRKMLMQCLTDLLLAYPSHQLLPAAWVSGVVPLFSENEVKAQEKVLELGEQVILHNLVPQSKCHLPLHKLPWHLISLITKMDMRRLFKFACQHWTNQKKIDKFIFGMVQSYIGGESTTTAWYFLATLSEFQDMPKPEFLLEYFFEHILNSGSSNELNAKLVLRCIALNWNSLPYSQRTDLGEKLRDALNQSSIPFALISPTVDIVWKSNPDAAKPWASSLIRVCEDGIMRLCEKSSGDSGRISNETSLCRYIFLLGDLTQIAPDVVSKETISILSNLIDIANWDEDRLQREAGRAHAIAVVTLGKLSLQNHITAKSLVPYLGALVSARAPSPIKMNACIALADLCVRISSLVEPYFGDMCVCLRDPDPDVRKNTLTLITRLVQEDFLKLKVPVFIYLLSMMKDPVVEIRDLASSFIVNSILNKHSHIMSQHIIPVIMFLNDYKATESVSPQEKATFCLCGEENTQARRELYAFMLMHMMDEMKFRTKYRICIEVLDPVSEGNIQLDATGTSILKDALYIMACEEIRLTERGRTTAGEDDDEESQTLQAAKNAVYDQICVDLMKKNLTENVVPAMIKLKHKLLSLKSPLLRDLMICLRDLVKDFKEQIDEILGADPELAAEVAHDLRQMENAERAAASCNSPEGNGTQTQDQDTLMYQVTEVAKRISLGFMKHGADVIAEPEEAAEAEEAMQVENGGQVANGDQAANGNDASTPAHVMPNSRRGRLSTNSRRASSALTNGSSGARKTKNNSPKDSDSDSDFPKPERRGRKRSINPGLSSPSSSLSDSDTPKPGRRGRNQRATPMRSSPPSSISDSDYPRPGPSGRKHNSNSRRSSTPSSVSSLSSYSSSNSKKS